MTTRMFSRVTWAGSLLVIAAAPALAKDPRGAKPVTPTKLDVPKPPADVDALAKTIVGIWRCNGTEHGMDGSAKPITGKLAVKVDLDRWWINDVWEGKGPRGTFKLVGYSTFDASSRKWRRVSVDSVGHQYVGTSDGMRDGRLTWHLDFLGTMGSGQFQETLDTNDGKNVVKLAGTLSMDKGKSWKPVYEMTCKK